MDIFNIFSKLFPKTITIRRELEVAANSKITWEALIDLSSWPKRDKYITRIQASSSNPTSELTWKIGYCYREQVYRGPFGIFRPTFNLTIEEVDEKNQRIMWSARYLLTKGEHSWSVKTGKTKKTSILISEEIFRGPRIFLAVGFVLFHLFDVTGMTDRQLSFIALDAEQINITQ